MANKEADCGCDSGSPATFNQGNGERETIMMTGPLGDAYTKALAVYFAKEPFGEELEREKPDTSVVSESQAMDATVAAGVVATQMTAPLDLGARLNLVTPETVTETPKVIAYVVDKLRSSAPETVHLVQGLSDRAKKSGKELIMVVNVEPLKESREVNSCGYNDILVPEDQDTTHFHNSGLAFQRATEALYEGVPVVLGMEGFAEWVAKRHNLTPAKPAVTADEAKKIPDSDWNKDGDHEYR